MSVIPKTVLDIVEEFRRGDSILDHQVDWYPHWWSDISQHPAFNSDGVVGQLLAVSNPGENGKARISRRNVMELEGSDRGVFLASMIFGFGDVPYGPSRVTRLLDSHAVERLVELIDGQAEAARRDDGEVWTAIRVRSKIKWLDIAFGTKFAYFIGLRANDGEPMTLIDDANTSWAAYGLTGLARSLDRRDSFLDYQSLCRESGMKFGCRPDVIECALFLDGRAHMGEYRRMAAEARSAK